MNHHLSLSSVRRGFRRVVAVVACLVTVGVMTDRASASHDHAHSVSLAGEWSMAVDAGDVGVQQKWYERDGFDHSVTLPGSIQSQGFGEPPSRTGQWSTNLGNSMLADPTFAEYTTDEDFGNPFWLTPKRLYVGVAWFTREITIPEAWEGQRVELFLERAHWGTTVYLNGEVVGEQRDPLGTPHVHDLTAAVEKAGGPGTYTLAIRVDNRLIVDVGKDAHAYGDQQHTNWNGIIGDIELRATPVIWIDNVQVFPDVDDRSVDLVISISNASGFAGNSEMFIDVKSRSGRPFEIGTVTREVAWDADDTTIVRMKLPLGDSAPLWTEFDPNVLELHATLAGHRHTTTFGLREVSVITDADGSQFTINGRPVFLRGALDQTVFAETGYPDMSVEWWIGFMQRLQAFGLNHVRFHSWCPPRAAFHAADELGMYIMAEASTWPNFLYAPTLPAWLEAEGDRMLREYGNHPSFVLMGVGNEFWNGTKLNDEAPMIEPAVDQWREEDKRRYYTTGAGWPQAPANDFHVTQDPRLQLYPGLRLTDPPRTDLDYGDYVSNQPVPIVTHEIGQWCSYPDITKPARSDKFLDARFLEMMSDGLERAGLDHLAESFIDASGRFQTLLYKAEIESALRTPRLAGFQLLGLADYPGHGFAPVGVLDHHLRSKGYAGPADYRAFNDERVLLARLESRVFEHGDTISLGLEIANYGEDAIEGIIDWKARGSASGDIARGTAALAADPGGLSDITTIELTPSAGGPAEEVTIRASVRGTPIANEWQVWVYPRASATANDPENVEIVKSIDGPAAERLENGATMVVLSPPAYVDADTFGSFRPIFWNRALFTTQREHTLGALIDNDHPALAGFPSRHYVTWQWWDVLFNSKPIPLDGLSAAIDPIVRPIDDWVMPRSLGLLFEARVGEGRVLVCAVDLETDLENRPAARALRESLLAYAASIGFDPQQRLEGWELTRLFRDPSPMEKLGASAMAANSHPGYGPELAL
ncbi:MAG: sugar-binding domain-containing protein, partial [Planctomycetota bacterium]